ncbi:MAG: 30S ribosomal protein S2 [Candidatus Hydrogenedentes bacterium]|nr:30S ribosomal protein S2 [Candidatus Hydrogenedentota bacterium]
MAVTTMRELLEAGIHFGHQTRRWHPKMKRYIYGQRNGIYIIDLQQTLRQLYRAYGLVRETVSNGGNVLFVGTKKQAQDPIQQEAERCGMFYVNHRWLGGTLTNFKTVRSSIAELTRLQDLEKTGKIEQFKKKEGIVMRKQRIKLEHNLAGIQAMPNTPQVMFVVDAKREHIAVREAERLGIPCIGIIDTNCDPDVVSIPIPGNDDAIRAVSLFCRVIADAVIEGRSISEKHRSDDMEKEMIRQKDSDDDESMDKNVAEAVAATAAVPAE